MQETGPHLYECAPSGNFYDYVAISIGARSQSAKTYLEKHYESFAESSLDDLVVHGLRALRETLHQDKELNLNNTRFFLVYSSIAIVGPDVSFEQVDAVQLQRWLDLLGESDQAAAPVAGADASPAAMDTE